MTDRKGKRVAGAKKVGMGDFVVLSDDEDGGYECSIFTSGEDSPKKKKKKKKAPKNDEPAEPEEPSPEE